MALTTLCTLTTSLPHYMLRGINLLSALEHQQPPTFLFWGVVLMGEIVCMIVIMGSSYGRNFCMWQPASNPTSLIMFVVERSQLRRPERQVRWLLLCQRFPCRNAGYHELATILTPNFIRCRRISMAEIFDDLIKEQPSLGGYLALTDGIIDVILNMVCCTCVSSHHDIRSHV